MKPEKLATKFAKDLETSGCNGMAFISSKDGTEIVFAGNTDNTETLALLTSFLESLAKSNGGSPWHSMEFLGYMLGKYPPPEDVPPQLKEFAEVAGEVYERVCRSH